MKNDLAQFPRPAPPFRLLPPLAHTGRVAMSDVKTVPEGWAEVMLGELVSSIQSGFSANAEDEPALPDEVGVLKLGCVYGGVFLPKQNKRVVEEVDNLKVSPKKGTIIISRANTRELVGMCGYVEKDFSSLFLSDLLWAMTPIKPNCTDFRWLTAFLSSPSGREKVTSLAAGSNASMVKINKESLRKLLILLPPLPEQHKIAAILSAWDDALATLARLIDTKRQQKRALAEQLLTGKRRLKGFEGEWKTGELGQFSIVEMGSSPSSSAYNSDKNGLPLIQGNADIKNRIAQPRTYTSEITRKCEAGDIILSVRAPVGQVAITFSDACIGRGVASIKAKEDQDFMYQLLIAKENSWGALIQGSTFESVTSKEVKSFLISLPPLPEQQSIASVLSILDAELSVLTRQQAAVQQQKRGLMDLLLTGRVRVKVDDLQTGP